MGQCTRHRIWLILIALLKWHENVLASWLVKEPLSSLPDEVDHVLAVCQESNMFLNCRNRYNKLVIKNTIYGRQNNHTCSSKVFDSDKLCDEETPDSVKQKVDLMCSGEHKCKVPVSPAFLEKKGHNICPGVRKYLLVTYACHQNPKLHMVCHNCSSKCWPLCQKQCCHPPQIVTHVKKAPEKLTCQEGCPNRCAPHCEMACCASKILGVVPEKSKKVIESSCQGDCKNICAPLCRPACCSRHKKSTTKIRAPKPPKKMNYQLPLRPIVALATCPINCPAICRPSCQPTCCTQIPLGLHPDYVEPFSAKHPDYVEPLSARLQSLQPDYAESLTAGIQECANGCHSTCAPLCSQQCCAYMGELRSLASPPVQAQVPIPPPVQAPVQPPVPSPVQAMAQPPVQAQVPPPLQSPVQALVQPPVQALVQLPVQAQVSPPIPSPLQAMAQPPVQSLVQPPVPSPVQAMAQPPVQSPMQAGVQPNSATTQAEARTAYAMYPPSAGQPPQFPNINQPPANMVTSQTLEVEEPNHSYQQIYPGDPAAATRGDCPPSCATSCDSSCKLGCCVNPNSYVFTTNNVGDDEQRKTYERLLAKYRTEQLAKYYQNRGFDRYQ